MGEPEPTLADVANTLADVMERLDAMQTDVSAIKKGQEHLTDLVQGMTTGHAERFASVERKLDEHNQRLGAIEDHLRGDPPATQPAA